MKLTKRDIIILKHGLMTLIQVADDNLHFMEAKELREILDKLIYIMEHDYNGEEREEC